MEDLEEQSILPLIMVNDNNEFEEIIVCDSISGGADYKNNMPRRVVLRRHLADGTEYIQIYIQDNEPMLP